MKELELSTLLTELSQAPGASGFEEEALEVAAGYLRPYVDRIERDPFGNLVAFKKGEAPEEGRKSLALAAHIDEIGAMVTKLEPGGFLRFTSVGGIDPRTLYSLPVIVHGKNRLRGVIGAKPPHLLSQKELEKETRLEDLFIDLGIPEEQVQQQVRVGDYITFDQAAQLLAGGSCLAGKALDNRAGVAALVVCARELERVRHQADLYLVATVQEEVGVRGAITAAYGLAPDAAVAVDVTHGEAPGISGGKAFALGSGPVIAMGPNIHPALLQQLKKLAKEYRIPHQLEAVAGPTSTDARAFQIARQGIPSALVSIPLRYMHSVVELLNLEDLLWTGRLLALLARHLEFNFAWEEEAPCT